MTAGGGSGRPQQPWVQDGVGIEHWRMDAPILFYLVAKHTELPLCEWKDGECQNLGI